MGLQQSFARGNGELRLFLGNKHGASPITDVTLLLPPASHPAMQAVAVTLGALPPLLAPQQQLQVTSSCRFVFGIVFLLFHY